MTCEFQTNALFPKIKYTLFTAACLFVGIPANAAPLSPDDFTSLGFLDGSAIALDTSALTVDGGAGGVLVSQGGMLPDIAVFTFDDGSLLGDVAISGLNPIAILFRGSATVSGQIDVSANSRTGVAGGGDGGLGGSTAGDGQGPGAGLGGSTSASTSGIGPGSGGGFGANGEAGGAGITLRAGGVAYGDPLRDGLQGGSGGGGGGFGNIRRGGNGGGGGGALEIGALTNLSFDGATITANGGDGTSSFSGGGGGSGGGLLLHAFTVDIGQGAFFSANGGDGGNFGSIGNKGGCGGAGRIEVIHNTAGSFANLGVVETTNGAGSVFCDQPQNTFAITQDLNIGMEPSAQVPTPATFMMFAAALGLLGFFGRLKGRLGQSEGKSELVCA